MRTECPHCSAVLNIPDGYSATQAQCPQCKRAFEIPKPDEEYTEAGTSPVFTALSALAVFAAFVLGSISGYYIAQPKRNAAQREAAAAKAEILRLSEALAEQAQAHNSKIAKLQSAAKQEQQRLQSTITQPQIVCDKFNLVTEVTGSTLDLSVDTDLPDNTVVMVSVSRSYWEKGNSAAYSENYFSESSTIGKWKSSHRISIASEKWKSALRTTQEKMSKIGFGFDVASVSDKIDVGMVVPINQPDPRFGERNSKLSGKAVIMASKGGKTISGEVVGPMYVVEDEIEIDYPLDSPPIGKSPFPNLNPLELEVGQAYIVSKQTPLMPSLNPADPMAAIEQMKQIPKGGVFKILERAKKRSTPWYKVTAFSENKQEIGAGWINSTALLGQQLLVNAK